MDQPFLGGFLTCPADFHRFCNQNKLCPDFCNYNGFCNNGKCICYAYFGESCSAPCIPNCQICTDGVTCSLCAVNYFFDSISGQCVTSCTGGFSIDKYNRKCTSECPTLSYNQNGTCQPFCNESYYPDEINKMCNKCSPYCQTCASYEICGKCVEGFYQLNGMCTECTSIGNCLSCNQTGCSQCSDSFRLTAD